MSLSGMTLSGSVSHLSRDSAFQVICAFLNPSEYLKDEIEPDGLPKTLRSRGPSLSLSSAWQPPQRLSKRSFPRVESCAPTAAGLVEKATTTITSAAMALMTHRPASIARRSLQFRSMSLPCERRIDHCQTVLAGHVLDIGNADHAAQAFRGNFHWTRRRCAPRRGLWKGRGHSRVESHIALHFLHDLVNIAVQHLHPPKPFDIRKALPPALAS